MAHTRPHFDDYGVCHCGCPQCFDGITGCTCPSCHGNHHSN